MGTTSNHHALYDLGYTRTTMVVNRGKQYREVEQNLKTVSVQIVGCNSYMKLELLVIADQHAAVNTFGLVHTARHTMGSQYPEVSSLTVRRTLPKVGLATGVKS